MEGLGSEVTQALALVVSLLAAAGINFAVNRGARDGVVVHADAVDDVAEVRRRRQAGAAAAASGDATRSGGGRGSSGGGTGGDGDGDRDRDGDRDGGGVGASVSAGGGGGASSRRGDDLAPTRRRAAAADGDGGDSVDDKGKHKHDGRSVGDANSNSGGDAAGGDAAPPVPEPEECPICLDVVRAHSGCSTNCGHRFCAACVSQLWEARFRPRAAACPICRRQVTMLVVLDAADVAAAPAAAAAAGPADIGPASAAASEARRFVRDYNERFSGAPRSLMSRLRDVPMLLRWLWGDIRARRLLFASVFVLRIVLLVLGGLVYLLLPVDLLPEAVFGLFGLMDDVLIWGLIALQLSEWYRAIALARRGP